MLHLEHQALEPFEPHLKRTAQAAHELNAADRLKFHVICDLTTGVYIGDLVQVDRSTLTGRSWRVVELKEGRMNDLLASTIEEKGGELSPADLEEVRQSLGDAAASQATRMLRQRARTEAFRSILQTDHGISPRYNQPLIVTPEQEYLDDYMEAVIAVCENANKSGVAMTTVDGCLRILALRSGHGQLPRSEELGAAVHSLYHIGEGIKDCVLNDREGYKDELKAMREIPPVIDLIDHNMLDPLARPIFVHYGWELVHDVVMGRIRVFAQFDMRRFFELAENRGMKLSWISRKESEDVKGISAIIPGSPGVRGIRVSQPEGADHVVLSGFFRRMMGDFTPPQELLRLMKKNPTKQLVERFEREGGFLKPRRRASAAQKSV